MKKITVVLIVMMFLLSACAKPAVVGKFECGKVISAEQVSTSWNESMKTQVNTESCMVILNGNYNIRLGLNSYLLTYSDDSEVFVIDEGLSYPTVNR